MTESTVSLKYPKKEPTMPLKHFVSVWKHEQADGQDFMLHINNTLKLAIHPNWS